MLNAIWVNAKDLQIGDRIRGSRNNFLEVANVQEITFEEKQDFYELSLKDNYTFYLIDSAGHYVLTHNIGLLSTIGIGALIGGIFGGVYVAWQSHKKGILSKEVLFKGVIYGAAVGVATALIIYGVVYLYMNIVPINKFSISSSKFVSFLSENRSTNELVSIFKNYGPQIYNNLDKYPKKTVELLNGIREGFAYLSRGIDVAVMNIPTIDLGVEAGKDIIDKYIVNDIYEAENKQIDFVGIDDGL